MAIRTIRSDVAALRALVNDKPAVAFDWAYWMCPLDTEAEWFGPFASLVSLWRSRQGEEGSLPRRKDFLAEEFHEWMGRIFIAKLEHDPFDLRFTLWGTTLSEWWRVDYTGQKLGAESSDPGAWGIERQYFAEMARQPFIGLASGSLSEYGRGHIKVAGLDLPLSDGARLDQVLSAHVRLGPEEDLNRVFRDCPKTAFRPR
ncbi:PAS domain-containing protein [Nisaea acidiphila]|uniref:PAS domain-containing protein n=1 Tax=Nisaea acidiphila TaxID=1862145 RepID=A0A9J7ARW1_9PROT|nr:PAS domain-containing protein [Nisaea acidiphila]UUX49950.1 PAS domain-containing protein [Nisaea acidiphila]